LQVELRDELAIGSDAAAVRSLLQTSPDGTIVCTHREVIASLLGAEQIPARGSAQLLVIDDDGAMSYFPLVAHAAAAELQPA
jgi:hypothetical protein